MTSGQVRPVTPEGMHVLAVMQAQRVLAGSSDGSLALFPLSGGTGEPLAWRLPADPHLEISGRSHDARFLFVREGSVPARVARFEIATGRRTPWKTFVPEDATGAGHIWSVLLASDGEAYAYTHGLFLVDLFLLEGLPT
jgi:hypothetical protein